MSNQDRKVWVVGVRTNGARRFLRLATFGLETFVEWEVPATPSEAAAIQHRLDTFGAVETWISFSTPEAP